MTTLVAAASLAMAAEKPMLSVQAWSFNRFTAFEAIDMTAAAGAGTIELFPGQKLSADTGEASVGPWMGEENTAKLKAHLSQKGVQAGAFGVTGIDSNEAEARKLFAWAKDVGIKIINTESDGSIDTIEKMVKEFHIKVGFHNHPSDPNNPGYRVWDPKYIAELVKNRDKRIGACADTGHWVRSGIKPVDALKLLRGRVVSAHMKDLSEFSRGGRDVPFGTGISDAAGQVREMMSQGFSGTLSVEYESNWGGNLAEVAQCVGFIRAMTGAAR